MNETEYQLELPHLKTSADIVISRLKHAAKLNSRGVKTMFKTELRADGIRLEATRFPYSTERLLDWDALKNGVLGDVITKVANEMEATLTSHESKKGKGK